ncbi:MAG TPA: O-antigen polymerase [Candidatus Brocadiaceae bacterium]
MEKTDKNIKIIPYVLFLVVLLMGMFIHLHIYQKVDLSYFWYGVYAISAVFLIRKFKQGLIFEPIFILPSSYFLLICIGTLFFENLKGISFDYSLSNLVGVGYLSLIVGIILSQYYNYELVARKTRIMKWLLKPMKNRLLVLFVILISLSATALLFLKGGVPLFANDVNEAKLEVFSSSGYLAIFYRGLPIFSLAILYDACITKDKKKLYYSNGIACIVLLVTLMMGYRSKTFVFVAEYSLLYLFFHRRVFSLKLFLTIALLFVMFFSVLGAYRRGNSVATSSVLNEAKILLAARPALFKLICENFDSSHYFYGSRYFYDFKKMLPGSQVGANVDLKNQIPIEFAKNMPDIAAVTPSIIGEAYMNFGPPGVFWIMLVLGIVLGINYKYTKYHPSFIACAFYFNFVFNMAAAVNNSIGASLLHFTYQIIWILITSVLYEKKIVLIFSKKGRITHEVVK